MSPRLVRAVVLVICGAGIVGMIVASVADANGAALTFGLITAGAVVCLIVATTVTSNAVGIDERRAIQVEELVQRLVEDGADEVTVRELVRQASGLRSAQKAP